MAKQSYDGVSELAEETIKPQEDDHLNTFTATITSLLLTDTSSNIILSPLSLYFALSTLRTHASGPTRAQLDQALGKPFNDEILSYVTSATKLWVDYTLCGDDIESSNSFSLGDLNSPARKDPCTNTKTNLNSTTRKDQPTLIVNTETFSHPEIEIIDFSKPLLAVDIINRWADTATDSLIPECIDISMIDPAWTVFAISNAVLFYGKWNEVFKIDQTWSRMWNGLDGKTWDVPMMRDNCHIPYYCEERWHAVKLEYKDNKGYMMVVLPREGLRLEEVKMEVIKRLGEVVRCKEWGVKEVKLSLPRFSFESSHDMSKVLSSIGLGSLTERCTLERFGEVVLGSVIQRAVIDLDETGTKVAAVTTLTMVGCALTDNLPVSFTCDEPFMFSIVKEGVVLFTGQVTEPDKVAEGGTWAEQKEAERELKYAEAAERRRNKKKSKCTVS